MLFHHLIERDAAVFEARRLLTPHAAEKGMHAIVSALHTGMLQLREHRHLLPPALQRLQQRRQLQLRPMSRREKRFRPHPKIQPDANQSPWSLRCLRAMQCEVREPRKGQRSATESVEKVSSVHEFGEC